MAAPWHLPCSCADDVQVTGIVVRQFDKAVPGLRCHIGLALQATSLLQDRDRQAAAALALTPEVVAPFRAFWEAHACLPMRGRNKVRAGTWEGCLSHDWGGLAPTPPPPQASSCCEVRLR